MRPLAGAGGRLIVRVVDRGPGIPPAQLERVFEPFYRAGTAQTGHRGSGLGLAIARGFTEANGGELRVESLPGQGATFVFELPLGGAVAAARGWPSRIAGPPARRWATAMAAEAPEQRPRILVVDDEPQIVRALKVVLREAGFEALAAETAEQALDLAAVQPPAAAIVDLVLPDGDGVEVTRRLREWSEIPILVLSAVGEEEQKVRALEAGADDYITKPFGARELVARLQAALRRTTPAAGEPAIVGRGAGDRPRRARGASRRRARAPHADRVRAAARARAQPRAADDPPGAARGGLGAGVCGRHPAAAHAHRAVASEDRAGGGGRGAGGPRFIVTDPGVGYRFAG